MKRKSIKEEAWEEVVARMMGHGDLMDLVGCFSKVEWEGFKRGFLERDKFVVGDVVVKSFIRQYGDCLVREEERIREERGEAERDNYEDIKYGDRK